MTYEGGALASFAMAVCRKVTMGVERQATIYAISANHFLAQLLHMIEHADRSWTYIPVSYPYEFTADASVQAFTRAIDYGDSYYKDSGMYVFERTIEDMKAKAAKARQTASKL